MRYKNYEAFVMLGGRRTTVKIKAENQLDLVLKVLELDENSIDIWFSDFFTEYYWSLIVFYGEKDGKKYQQRHFVYLKFWD